VIDLGALFKPAMSSPLSSPVAPHPARITVSGITVRFGGVIALEDVSLAVAPGEIRGLIGPNGAGKTTLFDVISGLRRPAAGKVSLDGADITRWSAMRRARRGVRRTFQRQQLFSWLTVEDNVVAALEWESGGGGAIADLFASPSRTRLERRRRDSAAAAIQMCRLEDSAKAVAGTLPIGKARLVELARGLVSRPSVLLLDEPTSAMSAQECRQVARIVADYRASTGCTVLLVEHDLEFVMGLCDAVTVLDGGRVIFDGPSQEARQDADVRKAYLG
jgi:branched-chain amino acid transport system ATP-binding protein